jgi:hypothetical protein
MMLFAASRESMRVVLPWSTCPRVVIIRTFVDSADSMEVVGARILANP